MGLPRVLSPHERLIVALRRGARPERAAQIAGVPTERALLMLDHLERAGVVRLAGRSGCEHGACSDNPSTDPEVALHCAGCPIAR